MLEIRSISDFVRCLICFRNEGLSGCEPKECVYYYYRGEPEDYDAVYGKGPAGSSSITRNDLLKNKEQRWIGYKK